MIYIPGPIIECSKCGSHNVVREIPANSPFPTNGRLVCRDCGHKGPESHSYPPTKSSETAVYEYDSTKPITF